MKIWCAYSSKVFDAAGFRTWLIAAPSSTIRVVTGVSVLVLEISSKHVMRSILIPVKRFPPPDSAGGHVWFSWQNNSSISSIPRLAADVQACEEILVILGGGVADLCSGFLELMCWTPSACYDVYWVIHCLCSIQQTLSGESLEVLLANLLIIHHGLHGRRTCNVLWIMND